MTMTMKNYQLVLCFTFIVVQRILVTNKTENLKFYNTDQLKGPYKYDSASHKIAPTLTLFGNAVDLAVAVPPMLNPFCFLSAGLSI